MFHKGSKNALIATLLMLTIVSIAACNGKKPVVTTIDSAIAPTTTPKVTHSVQLPQENLLLLCNDTAATTDSYNLNRYDLGTHEWSSALDGRRFDRIFSLPDQHSVLLQEQLEGEEVTSQTVLWRKGQEQFLFNNTSFYTQGQTDPTGQWLVVL
ncbi:MAG: hypothetical protein DWQ04_17075 [Chloroflexi bacterium]|nr:MAG: hypothetical protein DWQ04_17075 [Chloroflexota bacterium]